jgi:formate hydrogenlyase subunit 3/multisubunit Na+/H+ antiporter MnhD subunit
MANLFILVIFLIPVIISIGLCFLKDSNKVRRIVLNIILIINVLVCIAPLLYAYWETLPDGNMWSENGTGAIIWLYVILLPLCALVFIVLLILKFVFRRKSDVPVK